MLFDLGMIIRRVHCKRILLQYIKELRWKSTYKYIVIEEVLWLKREVKDGRPLVLSASLSRGWRYTYSLNFIWFTWMLLQSGILCFKLRINVYGIVLEIWFSISEDEYSVCIALCSEVWSWPLIDIGNGYFRSMILW